MSNGVASAADETLDWTRTALSELGGHNVRIRTGEAALLCIIKYSHLARSSQTVRNIQLGQVLVVALDESVPVRRHDHAKHLPSGENASAGGSRCRHDPIRAMLPRCQLQGRRVARQAHV